MKVRFIINPVAGTKGKVGEITNAVSAVLSGVEGIFEIKVSAGRADACRLSMEAKERGYDSVFACGGDGTINAVASAIVNSNTALGIIPTGSGNGFSRALAIPTDIKEALGVLVKGKVRGIDAGCVGKRYFFSTAGLGLEAYVAGRYDDWTAKGYIERGVLPYLPIVLREYLAYRTDSVVLRWGEESMEARPLFLTVANTREWGADFVIAPFAVPDDGLFDVCLVRKTNILEAFVFARKLIRGDITASRQFKSVRTRALTVEREAPGPVHADGEVFEGEKTVEFNLLPKALKVWTF